MTSKHLIHQFKQAIQEALNSKPSVRAIMRARSGKQRFPVAQWVEELEVLQSSAVEKHKVHAKPGHHRNWLLQTSIFVDRIFGKQRVTEESLHNSESGESSNELGTSIEPGNNRPGLYRRSVSQMLSWLGSNLQEMLDEGDGSRSTERNSQSSSRTASNSPEGIQTEAHGNGESLGQAPTSRRIIALSTQDDSTSGSEANSHNPSGVNTPIPSASEDTLSQSTTTCDPHDNSSRQTLLSVDNVIREKTTFNLQSVNPFFTDSTKVYAKKFERRLSHLDGRNSQDQLCIEEYLSKSEKDWFNRYRDVKLGRNSSFHGTPTSSIFKVRVNFSSTESDSPSPTAPGGSEEEKSLNDFELPKDYVPPSGLRKLLLYRIGDWPIYSVFLAFVSENPGAQLHTY
jgi:alpha-1,3-glucan synthase